MYLLKGFLFYISITFDPLYFSDDEISDNAEEFSEKAGEYFVFVLVEGCCKLPFFNLFFFFLNKGSSDYANYYQGLWDCEADGPDELAFQRGDLIYILSKVCVCPLHLSHKFTHTRSDF